MYKQIYNYLQENKILYSKQFSFQTGHSTDQAIVQLVVDQIYEDFEAKKYPLGMFIDLSKVFDTVDPKILLRKMEIYGIALKCFENYLTIRRQYIQKNNIKNTDLKDVVWWSSPGINIRSCLILTYVSDLQYASNFLDPILFTDDTNLFYTKENIKMLFDTVKIELQKISQWFISNNYL